MQFFLISDNVDTLAGMRMVGIDGVVVQEEKDVITQLNKACDDPNVAIVLITQKLFNKYQDIIFEYKLKRPKPLILEMPDRHSADNDSAESIKKYIAEVVGIKI